MKNKKTEVVKLDTINSKTILYKVAKAMIAYHGFYACNLDGKKTKIIA